VCLAKMPSGCKIDVILELARRFENCASPKCHLAAK
jgi:hypothetical protein